MDPMNGSGQTTKIAHHLDRKFIGIDKRSQYVKLAQKRLDEPVMLSNFMIPVYHPINWSDHEESGKKADAYLDISNIPKGFKFVFSKQSSKEVLGVRGNYLYYKNKKGQWICYIMARSDKPTKIKIGSFSEPKSPLCVVLRSIPSRIFHKSQLNEILPSRLVENRQPIKAVIDVLEYEGFLKNTGKKKGAAEMYKLTTPQKY